MVMIMRNEKFRWYLSQKQGWIKIFPGDRDWKFGVCKPLETKDLQEIVKKVKKSEKKC